MTAESLSVSPGVRVGDMGTQEQPSGDPGHTLSVKKGVWGEAGRHRGTSGDPGRAKGWP